METNPKNESKYVFNKTGQLKIEFKTDYDKYQKSEQIFQNIAVEAYALFWGRCTKSMKNKIETRSDFKLCSENNPFELL